MNISYHTSEFESFFQKTQEFIEKSDHEGQKMFQARLEALQNNAYEEALYWKPSQTIEACKHFKRSACATDNIIRDIYAYTLVTNEFIHSIRMAGYDRDKGITPAMISQLKFNLSNNSFQQKFKAVRDTVRNKGISDSDRAEINYLKKSAGKAAREYRGDID